MNSRLKRYLKASASILTLPMVSVGFAVSAQAQTGDDVIIVTGSRIATDQETATASPIQVLNGDELLTAGKTDLALALRQTPALQGSAPSSLSALQGADTTGNDLGLGLLNLRSLGIERTLVLQNGRRHVPGTPDQAAVDVSTIPSAMIKSVEVLTGGASSIYGADAVTGVVNFITREASDFDGFEVQVQGGISGQGDAEEYFVSAANGFETSDGKGRLVVGGEYTNSKPVFASDRDFAGRGQFSFLPNNAELAASLGVSPNADNTFSPNGTIPISSRFGIIAVGDGFASAFGNVLDTGGGPVATLGAAGVPIIQVFDNGVLRPYNTADIFVGPFDSVGGDGIAFNPDIELLLPDSERYVFSAQGEYDVFEGSNIFFEAKYAKSTTRDSTAVNGFDDDIPIALDNPFIPAALRTQVDALIAEGLDPVIAVSRDLLDVEVQDIPVADRESFRVVLGLEGNVQDLFQYEISANYGETRVAVTDTFTRIVDRYFAAIDAVTDPATGNIVCRSSLDPTAIPPVSPFPFYSGVPFGTFAAGDGSCQPINVLGENTITGPGADFVFQPTTERALVKQTVLLATIAGDLGEFMALPGGPIGFAAGAEYRKEESKFTPDILNTTGFTFGSVSGGPTSPSGGEYSVLEVFGETKLPLLRDLPFVKYAEITGSVRLSQYSTIGETFAWSAGARWQPIDAVTFRGTISTAVRSPNIGELFAPQQPASIGAGDDPCNPQFISSGTQFRAANCAALGIPAGYNSTNFLSAFVPGLTGGNPFLSEEKADTYTVGAIINPRDGILAPLQIVVDYYKIDIEGAIDTLDAFDIAQSCVDLPSIDNQFCAQIQRDPVDRFITGFTSGQINLGALETSGVDFSVRYGFELGEMGNLDVGVNGTRFISFNEFQDPTDLTAVTDTLGEAGMPEWIVGATIDWSVNDFSMGWSTRFENAQLLDNVTNDDVNSNPDHADPFIGTSSLVHDLTASYYFSDSLNIYGGVNNIADRTPYLASLSRPVGPRGRYFYLGARFKY